MPFMKATNPIFEKMVFPREPFFTNCTIMVVDCYELEMSRTEEERNAVYYANSVLKKDRSAF
jgi:hypothetical protein